jgi:ketosteroid isomerase-like protein
MSDKESIMQTLEDYATAYCSKDVDALMRVFDDSDEITLIGTGSSENLRIGQEEVKDVFVRNFRDATAKEFVYGRRNIFINGNVAVVAIVLTLNIEIDGNAISVPLRWTVSLIKRNTDKSNGRWVWVHRHASTPAAGQDKNSAYPADPKTP